MYLAVLLHVLWCLFAKLSVPGRVQAEFLDVSPSFLSSPSQLSNFDVFVLWFLFAPAGGGLQQGHGVLLGARRLHGLQRPQPEGRLHQLPQDRQLPSPIKRHLLVKTHQTEFFWPPIRVSHSVKTGNLDRTWRISLICFDHQCVPLWLLTFICKKCPLSLGDVPVSVYTSNPPESEKNSKQHETSRTAKNTQKRKNGVKKIDQSESGSQLQKSCFLGGWGGGSMNNRQTHLEGH